MNQQYINELSDQQVIQIWDQYQSAKENRNRWESYWQDCYDYALPVRTQYLGNSYGVRQKDLYDATAMDAVDQLAASLLGHLTPPWSSWFGFKPGPDLSEAEASQVIPVLEKISKKLQNHFDQSNFGVEIHQCFLDLVVGGTATLFFEETAPGNLSAFKFTSVPLFQSILEEGSNGFLNKFFQEKTLFYDDLVQRYPEAALLLKNQEDQYQILEVVIPEGDNYRFIAILENDGKPALLSSGIFFESPAISFRWMKSPGDVYGRSPVMKALPDIKTANKIVELVLKNASIAVTGIWQADDDGVLNPANIELVPGAIIPKAIGSQGLKPLDMPGRFDVSELVLNDLRQRIQHALLSDQLSPVNDKRMTATEVMERSAQMSLLLGATYGRLQTELLTPLIKRAFSILKRRGEIPDLDLDGRTIMIDYRSPLAKNQAQYDTQNILSWINTVMSMGAAAQGQVDIHNIIKHLASSMGVPSEFLQENMISDLSGEISDESNINV